MRRAARPWIAAALAAGLYAGFRFNECLGTDLVLLQEPAATALGYLNVLNPKRTPAVLTLAGLTLASAAYAVFSARPRRLAALGLGLVLAEDLLTALHVPQVLALERLAAGAPEWKPLVTRYLFDDVTRTVLLLGAALVFALGALAVKPEELK